jgi:hypothetical protein
MSYEVETMFEDERECGYRHAGDPNDPEAVGIYLVGGEGPKVPCDRLPFVLINSAGEPQSHFRGIKEINPQLWFANEKQFPGEYCKGECFHCPLGLERLNYGLLQFAGGDNYTPDSFMEEGKRMGFSRRVSAIPAKFRPGLHWMYIAHATAGKRYDLDSQTMIDAPAVITAFRPRIDLVINDPDNIPAKAKFYKDLHGENARIVKVLPKS